MITKAHLTGLKIHNILFIYLYTLPISFNSDNKLCASKQPKDWTYFVIFQLLLVQYFCCMWYVVLLDGWVQPNPEFTIIHKIMYPASGLILISICTIALIVIPKIHKLAHSLNGILDLELLLRRRNHTEVNEKQFNLGKLVVILNVFLGFTPWITVIMLLPIHLDYGYFFLQRILPFSIHRSTLTFAICVPFRVVILVPLIFEGMRLAAFFLSAFIILLESYLEIMQILWKSESKWKLFRKEYIHLFLLHQLIEKILNSLIYVLLNGVFWLIVACSSVFIKGVFTNRYEFGVVYFCGLVAVVVIALLATILPKICYLATSFQRLVANKRLHVNLEHVEITEQVKAKTLQVKEAIIKCRERHHAMLEGRALQEIGIKFGPFFMLHRKFAMEYFELASLRVFELTMMSKLW